MAEYEWWNEQSPRSPGVGRSNSRWRRSAASSFYGSPTSMYDESPFGLQVPREQRQTSRQASITNAMMAQTPFGLQVPDIQPRPTSNMYARYQVPTIFENNDIDLAFDFELPKQEYEKNAEDPYRHLPEEEVNILKNQLNIPPVKVKYFDLFRYADRKDLTVVFISAICAIAAGAALPGMTILFGSLTAEFRGYFRGTTDESTFTNDIDTLALDLVYLGIAQFFATYIYTVGFIWSGEHIAGKIREQYLASILRQNIGYFDKLGAGEITTRITADTNIIQDGISEKVGIILQALATFSGAYVVGFIKYWKLTLILMSSVVAIFLTTAVLSRFVVKYNKLAMECYAEGANIAEEVISSVRNAIAFGTQTELADRYDEYLQRGERSGFRTKAFQGSIVGIMMAFVYLTFSLGFWLASRYITDGETGLSSILTIVMAIMIGSFALGNIAPNIQAIAAAVAAATKIYATIDRPSPMDPASQDGRKLDVVRGHVELHNVKHIYPSRPEVTVMDGVDLEIPAGKTTALVGASGSGKSTIIGLLERFYDVVGGEVLLDGVNINELNLSWLRRQIALVSQEPTLFATTIAGNIRYGLIGTPFEHLSEEDQQDLIEKAAKMANAHDFICSLGKGYDTHVGERGFLLSGGQKQRIAIARAIVSNPKILLLDEATSALDTKSEGVVQAALDKASEGRTTIVIAHRLSTIRDADNIVVMSKGKIVEQGTHNDLLAREGAYFSLVEAQKIAAQAENRREEQELEEAEFLDDADTDLTTEGTIVKKHSDEFADDEADLELGRSRSISAMSVSSRVLANIIPEKEIKYGLGKLIGVIMSFNKQEWKWMVVGLAFAILAGAGQPVQSIFFAESVTNISQPDSTQEEIDDIHSTQDFWSWMYFMLSFVMVLTYIGQGTAFAWCSERLVHKARDKSFRYMLRQDIAFFDKEENSAGALTAFLSTETMSLAGMSGATLGTILLVSTTIVVGAILSLVIAWKMAVVCIACIPIIMFTGFARFWVLSRFQQRSKAAYARSAAYACEATTAIRTVAALTREQDVLNNYRKMVGAQEADSIKSVAKSSTLYAASQTSMFLIIALAFYWGSELITDGYLDMFQYFICFQSCVFGAQSAGVIFSHAADMGKAKNAASAMKTLFDRKPEIDTWSTAGEPMESMRGEVEFRDVHFRYPTRTGTPVLKGIDMHIQPGMYVALVGSSGCGKSTSISLLERFYNPLVGGIYVDGREISTININDYRKHIALVSQEPTLYAGTIRDNILLGSKVAPEAVSEEDVKRVCKNANIYEFIMSLPEGFDTLVGNKGSMLSGGQKQRIAIARALLREPRILLLDEATSALDSESEKVVQAALDEAAKGRTTIAVAHRLSTIQKADRIYVFDAGHIVEYGTHQELVARKGRYYELVNLQNLGATK